MGLGRGIEISEWGQGVSEGVGVLEGVRGSQGVELGENMGAGHLDILGCPNIQGASEHIRGHTNMGYVWIPPKSPIQAS